MTATMDFMRHASSNLVDTIGHLQHMAEDTLIGAHPYTIIDSTGAVIRKPAIPLCTTIPGGQLEEGTLIAVIGKPNPSYNMRFNIDFILDKCEHGHREQKELDDQRRNRDKPADALESSPKATEPSVVPDKSDTSGITSTEKCKVAFHFNPRFGTYSDSDVVVMNSKLGEWGTEERNEKDHFPFSIGTQFKLVFLVDKEAFRVAVNGKQFFAFKHRCDFKDIGRIHIEGNIAVDMLEFRKGLKYLTRSFSNLSSHSVSSENSSDSEHGPATASSTVKSVTISSPTMPYLEKDDRLGKSFNVYIAGQLQPNFKGNFVINLVDTKAKKGTIPFHVSIRPEQKMIVRNTMLNGEWSKNEEIYLEGPFPFALGTYFDLMICYRPDAGSHFSVSCNGQLSFEFENRMKNAVIDALEITGDQRISSIRYEFF